ncbi:hypothetical protein SLEP1_g9587 [Rubroshorea leprosula]|uniref:Uncharacterized protein n=1 Tax=Rubroshorea leprosula TaxID=152421 RepID=A0AAV5I5D4_9ROSI|nr:hypothetical protein SLEP1_g9587 [Rubroshorea leprosula]
MWMKAPLVDQFVDVIKQTVFANKHWIPPPREGSLYIRLTLMRSGLTLAVAASPDYTFLIFGSPVGDYHKVEATINLIVEVKFHKATPGGTGSVKVIGGDSLERKDDKSLLEHDGTTRFSVEEPLDYTGTRTKDVVVEEPLDCTCIGTEDVKAVGIDAELVHDREGCKMHGANGVGDHEEDC